MTFANILQNITTNVVRKALKRALGIERPTAGQGDRGWLVGSYRRVRTWCLSSRLSPRLNLVLRELFVVVEWLGEEAVEQGPAWVVELLAGRL
ncbi:hypothetical protein MPH_03955 [Macrophomina phaseolina MS6]|uniref:Uncharacterized protein n=1 Tax=Macrophomina phaseolina (strain MS6) TaxID=1126212 RepID=K2S8Q5_MACPH|nr:hypothetical protein MPH_03955 [Macrophomina phaseolina MS6]